MSEKCFRYDATCIHAYGIKEAQCEKCIQSALALLKRVEAGESVEIRKRDGEWPDIHYRLDNDGTLICIEFRGKGFLATGENIPEAAAAWNGGEG